MKPEFTKEAALAVKNSYVALRINDLATSRNAYRITIRQLESLIRLSEAIAKIHGNNKVIPAYVDEASRILRLILFTFSNSIIKIERNEVEMDNYDE